MSKFSDAIAILEYGARNDLKTGRFMKSMILNILRSFPVSENPDISTAATFRDAKTGTIRIEYNEDAFDAQKLSWVLSHEALHIIFDHITMDLSINPAWEQNHTMVNVAFDAQINSYIVSPFDGSDKYCEPVKHVNTPGVGYSGLNNIYEHKHWMEIFEYLRATSKIKTDSEGYAQVMSGDSDTGSSDNGSGSSQDDGSGNNQNENNDTSDKNNSEDSKNGDKEASKIFRTRAAENSNEGNKGESAPKLKPSNTSSNDKFSNTDKKIIKRIVNDAIKQAEKSSGMAPGSGAGMLGITTNDIQDIKIKPVWYRMLQKYICGSRNRKAGTMSTWLRPNRRFSEGPGHKVVSYQSVGVMVDVSGSMSSSVKTAVEVISKLTSFTNGIEHLIMWDTELEGEYKNVNKNRLKKVSFDACGGTDLKNGVIMMSKDHTDLVIIFTDLAVDSDDIDAINMLSKKKPVIIGLFGGDYNHSNSLNKNVVVINIDQD